jgi:hypothetical protein
MKLPITGGCLCSLVRYEISAKPVACVRNSTFTKVRPVAAATLDDPAIYKPRKDMWVVDAQPWDFMNPDLPKCDGSFWQ